MVRENAIYPGLAATYAAGLRLSPAAVEVNGVHVEQRTDLWWEKDAATRLKALNRPAMLLPSLALVYALDTSPVPTTAHVGREMECPLTLVRAEL